MGRPLRRGHDVAPPGTDEISLMRLRAGLAAVLVLLLAAALWLGHTRPELSPARALDALGAIRGLGPAGWLALAAAQAVVAASGVLPASVVGVAAGAVYGIVLGFALSGVSLMLGAAAAFELGRTLLRPWAARLLSRRPRLRELDRMVAQRGWVLVALLRASPVMPFAATSYALGLSAISLRDYVLGTLASLPALLGYVCLGALGKAGLVAGAAGAGPVRWVLLVAGLASGAALAWMGGRIVTLALRVPGELGQAAAGPD